MWEMLDVHCLCVNYVSLFPKSMQCVTEYLAIVNNVVDQQRGFVEICNRLLVFAAYIMATIAEKVVQVLIYFHARSLKRV